MPARPRLLATLDGIAVEGGLDGAGEPATCFGPAALLGQCPTTGDARGLWRDYEAVLDAAADLGLDGVRVTLEWARLEPRPDEPDEAAFARYRRLLAHARERDLRVTGVLVDAAWPAWLGQEAWLLPWVPARVVLHAERVVHELGEHLDALVDFARPEAIVAAGFRHGVAPPWRTGATADAATAHRSVTDLRARLRASRAVGATLLDSFREVPAVRAPAALRALIDEAHDVQEIHLRSLVRGVGPTAGAAGLVDQVDGVWRVAVSDELRDVWR